MPLSRRAGGDRGGVFGARGPAGTPVFARFGGRIHWRGPGDAPPVGPAARRRHAGFIAQDATVAAGVAMGKAAVCREALAQRQAAVAGSRLIRFAPAPAGAGAGFAAP